MRKLLSSILVALFCCFSAHSQSCFPNGITFSSQQEINDFKILYPGCKVIEGDVNIYGDIISLNGLSNITTINGTLSITDCPSLTNLNGLANLSTIGHLYLASNNALTSVSGLSKLTTVGSIFFIQDNNALTNLNGLQNLKTVGGDCWIHYSSALTDISGLSGLISVGGELGFNFATAVTNLNALSNLQSVGSISFSWNEALADISGLQNIAVPLDSIAIWGNPNLLSLNGLHQITDVNGPVFILFNEKLSNLAGLEGLAAVGGKLTVSGHKNLMNLNALANLVSVGGSVEIKSNDTLSSLNGLSKLQSIGGDMEISAEQTLSSLNGLNGLQSIGGKLKIQGNPLLTDLSALQNLAYLGGNLELNSNYILPSLNGFGGLSTIGGGILIDNNDNLISLDGLQNINGVGGELFVSQNDGLANLNGLNGLHYTGGSLVLANNPSLSSLSGLQNLETVGAWVYFTGNNTLLDLSGLDNLMSVGDYVFIKENNALSSLAGLGKLGSVGGRLAIWNNPALTELGGLGQLASVGGDLDLWGNALLPNLDSLHHLTNIGGNLNINFNNSLLNINGLKNIFAFGGVVGITNNYKLAECSILPVCQRIFNDPASVTIQFNASGCQTQAEIEENCSTTPVFVSMKIDADGDCQPDAANLPVADASVWLSAPGQATLRPTGAAGIAGFRYFNNGPCFLMPAQFPNANWEVCGADTLEFVLGVSPDTTTFLLKPKNQCPELTVNLGLPSIFSDCSIASPVLVFVKNSGTVTAQGIQIAVAMPPEFDLISAIPPVAAQSGDTLFFEIANLAPLSGAEIWLTVKTKCSGVPTGRALCWSALGTLANGCPVNPSPVSKIKLSAECTGNKVRFTLKNIGNAATQGGCEYTIFRNGAGQTTEPFALAPGETKTVEVNADGATYRIEATQSADSTLTAISHEGCGGLTPGWTTAFWQDTGPLAADFDCRQVGDLKQFTGKNAIPAGVGPNHLLIPNHPLRYTIDFHNFEAEDINAVSLRDMLPPELDVNSVRPRATSHPFTWDIRHGNVLNVKFAPIQLGDTLGNPADAHGFFTFEIDQQPNLPNGAIIENTSEAFFGNTYSAGRDTTRHTIDKVGANSQKCLPTIPGFGFYSQQHIDDFPVNYPGCTEIEGDLIIGEYQNDINNLNGFSQLRSVGGSIHISNCGALKTLNGLHNLRHVRQGLSIGAVPLLTDLSGLENLRAIDSLLVVQGCHGLKSLHGLDSLRQVKFVNINYNDSLTDLTALARLPHDLFGLSVGGAALTNLQGLEHLDSIGAGGLNIESSALPDLDDLNNIKSVAGDFTVQSNHGLGSLAGLSNLMTVGSNFTIYNNSSLTSLDGLSKLTAVGGSLTLYYLENMLQPHGPPNLKTIGSDLSIKGMPQLDNLGGLASLDSIGGYLIFQYNPSQTVATGMPKLRHVGGLDIYGTAMQHLTGLDSLRAIPQNVLIYAMPALLDFKGLGNLETVGGRVEVFQNPVLKNFDGLGKLRSVGDSLMVWGNADLANFIGMTAFQEIGKQAYFYDNAALANFAGLENLRKIGDSLLIFNNPALTSMAGLSSLDSIGGDFYLHNNQALNSLVGLDNLRYIGEDFDITDNLLLTQLVGLERLERIEGDFLLGVNWFPNSVTSLQGLDNLIYVGGNFSVPENLQGFNGVEKLAFIGGNLEIAYNPIMASLSGLEKLETVGGNLQLNLPLLTNLHGLEKLATVGGWLSIYCPGVMDLTGLGNLKSIGGDFGVANTIKSYKGIENLESIGGNLTVDNLYMKDFSGFESLKSIGGYLRIAYNQALENLHGLESLSTVGSDFRIDNNPQLLTLDGLDNLDSVGGTEFWVLENPLLSDCDIYFICNKYFTNNSNPFVATFNNAPGCDAWWEVKAACNTIPVHATVLIDNNGDCLPDPADTPVENVRIQLSGGNGQMSLRPTGADGAAQFRYFNNGDFTLYLPDFPSANWNVCQDDQVFSPGSPGPLPDTIEANFLLSPGQMPCPELEVELGLPSVLRNCLVNSDMAVSVKNTGDAVAEFVTVVVVKPKEIELLASVPPLTAQTGDTLYFELGDIAPLATASVQMKVRTNCNFFLFQRTLCFEAYSETLLPCPTTPLAPSEIKLSAQCLADTAVRFTLKNIGDAPTLAPHQYILYRNTTPVDTSNFSLAAHETLTLNLLTDGSTHRMEATKRDDGTRTAAALEGCGGFTSGMINAFWLDKGPPEYDFDCREVVGSFDPNQKTAVPTGMGPDHLLAANYPLIYTIDFQNTGTDTARRVLLRDVLSANLDVSTFRPGFASHPYTWEIRGVDSLDVLFFPIALPDSNVNEPASHGFFTFTIDQKPDLPDGTTLENTADIIFDFNPPIVTNTVRHSIGQLSVAVDEAQEHLAWWQVLGNPTRESATFLAKKFIPGEKRFELFDASGRMVRQTQFSGQSFDFHRDALASGLYFFRISDEHGRWFSGKIMVTD